jgi:exopolysaccharide biosynthesis polyprenyl glycosylphosphotransferase
MSPDLFETAHLPAKGKLQKWFSGRRIRLPSLSLHFSERRLFLILVDLLIINGSLLLTLSARPDAQFILINTSQWLWFIVLSGLWLAIGVSLNIYDLAQATRSIESLWWAGSAALLTSSIYLFVPYITPTFPERRIHVLVFVVLSTLGIIAWRTLYARVFVQPVFQQRVLVVGAGCSGRMLAQTIFEMNRGHRNPSHSIGYHIIGFVDDDNAKQNSLVENIPVLGNRYNLVQLNRELRPKEIIVAITDAQTIRAELFQAIQDCREMGTSITTMTAVYERLTNRVPLQHAGYNLYVVTPLSQPDAHRFYLLLRRAFDILVGLLGCGLLLCVIPFVWLINRVSSPGPLFYRQQRVGRGGRPFTLIKFRSMIVDAEKHTGAVWATAADKRITPFGRFLRKTRLDELPQCWNVLCGEMSLIGPRPERPELVASLAHEIPFYRLRHAVKPGLTGWAQVKYRYGASVEDAQIKLQYDLYYIKHEGPFLDLLILLKTIRVVLGFMGR